MKPEHYSLLIQWDDEDKIYVLARLEIHTVRFFTTHMILLESMSLAVVVVGKLLGHVEALQTA